MCTFSDYGYYTIGPLFQGNDGFNTSKRDFMGSMLDDIDEAINYCKAQQLVIIDSQRVFLGGDQFGAQAVLLYLDKIGKQREHAKLKKVAVRNPAYKAEYQLENPLFMAEYETMFEDLSSLYHMSKQEVIDKIFIPRSPANNHSYVIDSILIGAAMNEEVIRFTNSNDCAYDLSLIDEKISFRYILYYNETDAFDSGASHHGFNSDVNRWFTKK